jgi:hypothetical protein
VGYGLHFDDGAGIHGLVRFQLLTLSMAIRARRIGR